MGGGQEEGEGRGKEGEERWMGERERVYVCEGGGEEEEGGLMVIFAEGDNG